MKVKLEVDATPEEWRRFFGMPDVSELNQAFIEQAKEKIASGDYDFSQMLKQFMPENMQQMADMQQQFWTNLFNQDQAK